MQNKLHIQIQANSSQSKILGEELVPAIKFGITNEESILALKVKVCSPARENQANEELLELLAKHYKVAKSKLQIIKGHKSKYKTVVLG